MKVTFDLDFLKPALQRKIDVLQDELLKMPQADIVTTHAFKNGQYIRTMIVPPNTVIVGAAGAAGGSGTFILSVPTTQASIPERLPLRPTAQTRCCGLIRRGVTGRDIN